MIFCLFHCHFNSKRFKSNKDICCCLIRYTMLLGFLVLFSFLVSSTQKRAVCNVSACIYAMLSILTNHVVQCSRFENVYATICTLRKLFLQRLVKFPFTIQSNNGKVTVKITFTFIVIVWLLKYRKKLSV